jgi:hypothetical protein
MSTLAARKCVRHAAREAVARCVACTEHFCRECVVEHTGALLCAACLAKEVAAKKTDRVSLWQRQGRRLVTLACVVLLWVAFYAFGQFLKNIPPEVHEGTLWKMKLDS